VFNGKKYTYRQHGFTLVEVMIALLVFMVIMLGLAKSELSALSTQSGNLYRDEALRLAEDELSRLKGENFTVHGTSANLAQAAWSAPVDLTVNMRGGSTTFARSIQITDIASTVTALKRIDVAVGWTHGKSTTLLAPTNRNRQTSISTIIVQGD
jgi:prepilin-type N-terminal cleavage/methylation domain-containing protein